MGGEELPGGKTWAAPVPKGWIGGGLANGMEVALPGLPLYWEATINPRSIFGKVNVGRKTAGGVRHEW